MQDCLPVALADFAVTGPTHAAQFGIPLSEFLAAVCHGQDFPLSNAWYVVNDPAGTDLLSLASGNTTPYVTQPGHIYWIQVQGSWDNGPVRHADNVGPVGPVGDTAMPAIVFEYSLPTP